MDEEFLEIIYNKKTMVINNLKKIVAISFAKRQYSLMVKKINFGKPFKVLDVGGSSGIFAREVLKKLPKKVDYLIIDVDKKSLIEGKKRYPQLNFKLQNAENMDFKNNEFDLVICKDVLHHCKHPEKAISEIKRGGEKVCNYRGKKGG